MLWLLKWIKRRKKDVDGFLLVPYYFQRAKVTHLGLQLGGLYYYSSVKSKSIMSPAMLLPGRIAGQHNSVKLQYSLTFNFLCVFSHARRVRAHPKAAAFLLSKNMFMQTRCRNSPGIQGCKSYFTSLSGRARYGFPPCVKTLVLHTRVFMFIHRISSWCSFLDAWNWQQFGARLL